MASRRSDSAAAVLKYHVQLYAPASCVRLFVETLCYCDPTGFVHRYHYRKPDLASTRNPRAPYSTSGYLLYSCITFSRLNPVPMLYPIPVPLRPACKNCLTPHALVVAVAAALDPYF